MIYGQHVKSKADNDEVSKVVQDKVDNALKRIDVILESEKDKNPLGRFIKLSKSSGRERLSS